MTLQRLTTILLMSMLCLAWACGAQANLIFVDTLDDELNTDGDCSLREAVAAANDNVGVDDCTSGGVADTIFILLAGDIELATPLVITEQVDIVGSGRDQLTIRSAPDYLVSLIKVDMVNTDDDFKLEALTLRDGGTRSETFGFCCGALQLMEGGTFRVEDVAFINNQALINNGDLWWAGGGAIFAGPLLDSEDPRLIVEDSVFEDNTARHDTATGPGQVGYGGAILALERYNTSSEAITQPLASVQISRSQFRGNSAGRGSSAVHIQGDTVVTITDSLFEDNLDPWDHIGYIYSGGVVFLWLYSDTPSFISNSSFVRNVTDDLTGVVYVNDGIVTIHNSTFANNNSPPLQARGNALVAVNYSTMSNNGQKESLLGEGNAAISMRGSIVWHDNAVAVECDIAGTASYTSLGHNIDSDSNCSFHPTDLPFTDPQLAPLAYYGDAITEFDMPTLLPDPGGPAVDGGELDTCTGPLGASLTYDQRGETRPVDGAESGADLCDIGAVEYQFEQDPEFGGLSVQVLGTGKVTSNIGGIDCPSGACSASYIEQTVVRLTATPGNGHEFVEWSGACSGSAQCQVQIANNKNVTASFQAAPVNEVIFKDGFEDP